MLIYILLEYGIVSLLICKCHKIFSNVIFRFRQMWEASKQWKEDMSRKDVKRVANERCRASKHSIWILNWICASDRLHIWKCRRVSFRDGFSTSRIFDCKMTSECSQYISDNQEGPYAVEWQFRGVGKHLSSETVDNEVIACELKWERERERTGFAAFD